MEEQGQVIIMAAEAFPPRKKKFRYFPREIEIYSEQMKTANDSELFLQKMYEHLKPGDVPDDLRLNYEQAFLGNDLDFKERMIQRIYRVGKLARYIFLCFFEMFMELRNI